MGTQDWSDNIMMVDLDNDPDFTDELSGLLERMSKEPRDVVLNFANVRFINSSNVSLLLKVRKILLDNKRKLRLCSIPVQVWGVFLLTGLDSIFDVAEDKATALAGLQMRNSKKG
jgi:anti-anti-sigma factor